ncbi:MAG TPA: TIGR03557 family F420-dependent LLM class oxidoreductase [Ktedonobacterales bacterium]|nr:TIGR03557 family F420-dependent LLM class oxidoreductase [Ktedonobacterales bacterium]
MKTAERTPERASGNVMDTAEAPVMFGWKAGPEQYPPDELLDYAVAAEAAGFDFLDVSDHFHPWSDDGQACFTWTWLGAAAARTSRIRLGTGVTCPILRYHPAVIAQAAATLAVMAPNRAYLSVGTGEALNEYAATGSWPEYDERQERLREAIALIRQLWTGEPVTFSGTYYSTRQARLYTRPQQPIPLYISSLVPESARFVGEQGDGLVTVGGEQPEHYQQMLHQFEQGARSAGKDPTHMPRAIELNVALARDSESAISAMSRYWAGTFIPALFDQKIYTPAMSAKNGAAVGPDTIRQKSCITANPADHIAFARRYLNMGFTDLIFHSAGPDQRAFIEGYGREVLPELRRSLRASQRRQHTTAAGTVG